MQSREHARRTREGRRPGGHSSLRRPREEYRIDTPSPASIPSRLTEKFAPRSERSRRPTEPEGGPAGHPVEVPENYGIDRLGMMARDPYWLHAYWEVTPDSIERAREQLGDEWDDHRWILRIQVFRQSEGPSGGDHFDVELNPDARNWYVRLPHPNCSYEGTIGVISAEGTFYPFARSGRVYAPTDSVSDDLDEEWTTLPEQAEEIYALSGGKSDGASSADVAQGVQPDSQEALFSGMLGSMGSGAMGARDSRDFWLQVNTELVLYGATQPDAQLTVQGRPIRLRPDGTFTLRFQLPDGVQEIPCVATSADGESERTITPVVSRQTNVTEEKNEQEAD
jgi:hypothetical protein